MGKEIKLYHGSIYDFNWIDLSKCKDAKDFGKGFYLTRDLNHAKSVAQKGFINSGFSANKYVYSFDMNLEVCRSTLAVHEFKGVNYAWLEFVIKNRMCLPVENYDIIIGATADARAQNLIADYYNKFGLNGTTKDKNVLIEKLKTMVFSTQYCFRSERSLNHLKNFVRRNFV